MFFKRRCTTDIFTDSQSPWSDPQHDTKKVNTGRTKETKFGLRTHKNVKKVISMCYLSKAIFTQTMLGFFYPATSQPRHLCKWE